MAWFRVLCPRREGEQVVCSLTYLYLCVSHPIPKEAVEH